jgi:hypothetical protein
MFQDQFRVTRKNRVGVDVNNYWGKRSHTYLFISSGSKLKYFQKYIRVPSASIYAKT